MISLSDKFMRDLAAMKRAGLITDVQICSRVFTMFACFLSEIENPDLRATLVKEAICKLPDIVADLMFGLNAKTHLAPYVESPRVQ